MTEGRGSRATLQRRMLLLGMIPRHPRKRSAPEMVEWLAHRGMDVSLRTIERDLEGLSLFLPLARDDRERPYGWYWTMDAPLQDVPALDPETALTLCVLNEHASSLLPPIARARLAPLLSRAEEVLATAGDHSGLQLWPERVRILSSAPPLIPPAIGAGVFETVQQALLERRCLDIDYRSRSKEGALSHYRVHPLALVLREPMTYLVATVGDYTDPRHLALNRFESASISDEAAREPPGGFDLNTFVASGSFDYPEEGEIRLELRVDAALAYHLQEAALSEDQELVVEDDGRMRLTATVRQTARLRWWILGLGTAVEVLGPQSLRAMIASHITDLALRYGAERRPKRLEA